MSTHTVSSSAHTSRTSVQIVSGLFGAVFLLVGILGFIPGITTDLDTMMFAGHHSQAALLGRQYVVLSSTSFSSYCSSKGDFVGRAGVEAADLSDRPVLVGLVADGRRAARAGAQVRDADGREVGAITSGVLSPTLGHPIAMGFVAAGVSEPGTELVADVRGKDLPVRVVKLPFYSRS